MSITFHSDGSIAHLTNGTISYVIELLDHTYLLHRYFGQAIRAWHGTGVTIPSKRSYTTEYADGTQNLYFDALPFEYPTPGRGDYRLPALTAEGPSGAAVVDLKFCSWQVLPQKPRVPGLPMTFSAPDESETLEIVCSDPVAGIKVHLYYTIFRDLNIITRHQRMENTGNTAIRLRNVQSLSLELPARDYELLTLYGCHAKEANQSRALLHQGVQRIGSCYGSSSPRHQPFFALLQPGTAEQTGEVYGFQLIYSGNFSAAVEKDTFGQVRAQIGLNPDTFTWTLEPGKAFDTPEAVLNYSTNGLNGMRQGFHKLIRNHIMPPRWRDAQRPVLLNSWEAMYYDVSLDKIETQAQLAKELGIELFVLDDGWFRVGNDSRSSMGDWTCNQNKLPGGIDRVASIVHAKRLKFGLWFEPEAVSPNSQLYRTLPDWIVHVPSYAPVKGRHEYLLDLGRAEVRQYLLDMLHGYLAGGQIDYIKWDMNRPLTVLPLLRCRLSDRARLHTAIFWACMPRWMRSPDAILMYCLRAARAAVRALIRVCCIISRRTGRATTPMPATASPFSRGSICFTHSRSWGHMSASPPTIRPAAPLRSTRGIRYAGCTIWAMSWT